ncbi:MAG: N-acetylglucosamine-6-phosphate deacetylase [Acidobacteria bacterium]|nr:N-acetylglucosamine-6-phosphate deacetylase [Acidobacteriota bacterium]
MSNRLAVVGGAVVTSLGVIERGIVLCEDARITYVGEAESAAPEPGSQIIDASGHMVFPGLIDTHVHGSGGDDLMSGGAEAIRRVSRAQLKYGVTGYLPTTIAARHTDLLRMIEHTLEAEKDAGLAAEILGFHLEGPYINIKYKGAQPDEGIRDPDFDECRELLEAAPGRTKIMTLAPELPGGMEMIRWLTSEGVTASLGHSEADYDTALAAIDAGATHATHLYNAMSGVHHRRPGLAAACLNEPGIRAEIILDGVHVHRRMAQLALRAKGRDGLVIITDATAAQGCPDGVYALGDFQIRVRGPLCTLMDGETIAGSVLTMNRAARHAIEFMHADLADAAHMAAMLPAKLCGAMDRKGSLEVGKDADLAVFDVDFDVVWTVLGGEIAYKRDDGTNENRRKLRN